MFIKSVKSIYHYMLTFPRLDFKLMKMVLRSWSHGWRLTVNVPNKQFKYCMSGAVFLTAFPDIMYDPVYRVQCPRLPDTYFIQGLYA